MLPLDGIRVVNVGFNLPACLVGARLAELGASILKVEPPRGDPVRHANAAYYDELTHGQRVCTLDLKQQVYREALTTILDESDVLLTASRPEALERLGLDAESLLAVHPELVVIALVGHGGDDRSMPGHDLTYLAASGLLCPPDLPRTLIADIGGAERAASMTVAMLVARERGSRLRSAEVALSDAAQIFAGPWRHGLTDSDGLLGGASPFYAIYRSADGWVALAALEPGFQEAALAALGGPEVSKCSFETVFRARTSQEWETVAAERDIPLAAVADHAGGRM